MAISQNAALALSSDASGALRADLNSTQICLWLCPMRANDSREPSGWWRPSWPGSRALGNGSLRKRAEGGTSWPPRFPVLLLLQSHLTGRRHRKAGSAAPPPAYRQAPTVRLKLSRCPAWDVCSFATVACALCLQVKEFFYRLRNNSTGLGDG